MISLDLNLRFACFLFSEFLDSIWSVQDLRFNKDIKQDFKIILFSDLCGWNVN